MPNNNLFEGISVGLQADFHHLERVDDNSFSQACAQTCDRQRLQEKGHGFRARVGRDLRGPPSWAYETLMLNILVRNRPRLDLRILNGYLLLVFSSCPLLFAKHLKTLETPVFVSVGRTEQNGGNGVVGKLW